MSPLSNVVGRHLALQVVASRRKPFLRNKRNNLSFAQMDKDPGRCQSVRTTQHKIAFRTGVHLTRDYIMHIHDSEGSEQRQRKRLSLSRKFLLEFMSDRPAMDMTNSMV
jgi:hypothetical protein